MCLPLRTAPALLSSVAPPPVLGDEPGIDPHSRRKEEE